METKASILVIDDESIVGLSCQKCLIPEGYDVDSVESGKEGLDMIRDREYDLVITDLKMPDIDGLELLKIVLEIKPGARVIMITGYSTVKNAVKAIKMGAYNYMEKPFTPDELLEAVQDALESED